MSDKPEVCGECGPDLRDLCIQENWCIAKDATLNSEAASDD